MSPQRIQRPKRLGPVRMVSAWTRGPTFASMFISANPPRQYAPALIPRSATPPLGMEPSNSNGSTRGDALTFLQLRAYQPAPNPAGSATGIAGSAAHRVDAVSEEPASDDDWTWDAAHNPLPLSPAQAGLVELVDAKCSVGFRQKVVGGYLFFRRSG